MKMTVRVFILLLALLLTVASQALAWSLVIVNETNKDIELYVYDANDTVRASACFSMRKLEPGLAVEVPDGALFGCWMYERLTVLTKVEISGQELWNEYTRDRGEHVVVKKYWDD